MAQFSTSNLTGLGQLKFPVTANPSTNPNVLDDYEEGSWTPVCSDAVSGGNTYTGSSTGSYIRIGKLCTVFGYLPNPVTTSMTGTNDFFVQGLPFTVRNVNDAYVGSCVLDKFTFDGFVTIQVSKSTTALRFAELKTGIGEDWILVSQVATGAADAWFTVAYQVA